MANIFFVMGKSASGKDTIYKELASDKELGLKTVIPYTTRPMRDGEKDGVTYHFTSEADVDTFDKEGRIIELRAYNTVHGVWKYFTLDDGQIKEDGNYIVIGTLESYGQFRKYFGAKNLFPIYVEVEDGERLIRAIKREQKEVTPKYEEMCRRFLADAKDFSEENISMLEINVRYVNNSLSECISTIKRDILTQINK